MNTNNRKCLRDANITDRETKIDEFSRRKAVMDRILSKSHKIKGMKTADLVKIGRDERMEKINERKR